MIQFPTDKQHIAIIDFEATCTNKGEFPRNEMEIIEIGCLILNRDLKVIDEFNCFVKPVRNPTLTAFCTELTCITQEDVDKASDFAAMIDGLKEKIRKYNPLFASWGAYDKNQLLNDCAYHSIAYPFDDEHLDIKRWIPKFLGLNKPKGIGGMLNYLNLQFEGTPHRGRDDVNNILRILKTIRPQLSE
ncbi:MAG: exonuclease domain-containing protein [Candidatus Heimdallarchaeota archaeon]|nr:exonuclease domain-containing protein [Candidatus Heimdallarchaeota archaeon]